MSFFEQSNYYSGKESHKYVEPLIKSSKELYIVSPYIDAHYAKFLKKNSSKKEVKVISSSLDLEAKKILTAGKSKDMPIMVVMVILIFDYFVYQYGLLSISIMATSVLAIIIYLIFFSMVKDNIKLKIPTEFVHAKLYISNEMAIHGSANLTYNGMYKNIEHIEIVRDKQKIESLKRDFMKLWESS